MLDTLDFFEVIPYGYKLSSESTDDRIVIVRDENIKKDWNWACKVIEDKGVKKYLISSDIAEYDIPFNTEVICENIELPSKEYADAIIALSKLLMVRSLYIGDWKPVLNGSNNIYCIMNYNGEIKLTDHNTVFYLLSFPSKGMCEEFYNNNKELIELAKPVL